MFDRRRCRLKLIGYCPYRVGEPGEPPVTCQAITPEVPGQNELATEALLRLSVDVLDRGAACRCEHTTDPIEPGRPDVMPIRKPLEKSPGGGASPLLITMSMEANQSRRREGREHRKLEIFGIFDGSHWIFLTAVVSRKHRSTPRRSGRLPMQPGSSQCQPAATRIHRSEAVGRVIDRPAFSQCPVEEVCL